MQIENVAVFTPDFTFKPGYVRWEGAHFCAGTASAGETVIDGQGLKAIPGLVDIHFHGAFGHDFMEATPQALSCIAKYEASVGVTTICPATMTMSREDIVKACANARSYTPDADEASLGGIYMEGPFVSPNKVGAQNPQFVHAPSLEFFDAAQQAAGGLIRLLAIAPELPGALQLIATLKGQVLPTIAHTTADYATATAAIAAGATHLTHLYNAMPPLAHRAPGPIGAGADAAWCEAEIICDGIHIHPSAVRAAFKLFGPERMILISDSMMAVGLPNGQYSLGGQAVTVKDRTALLANGTIAGSATNLFDCMKIAHLQVGLPLETAVRCATYNPARSIGQSTRFGSIAPGCEANLLLIDDQLKVKAIVLRGNVIKNEL